MASGGAKEGQRRYVIHQDAVIRRSGRPGRDFDQKLIYRICTIMLPYWATLHQTERLRLPAVRRLVASCPCVLR